MNRVRAWADLARRTVRAYARDDLGDSAAALTYYGLLALFPALIAMVSLVGVFADPKSAASRLTEIVTRLGPSTAADTFAQPLRSITANRGGAGVAFFVGLALALWAASNYVAAFVRASDRVHGTRPQRMGLLMRPFQLLVTLVMVVLAALVAISLVLTGPVVDAVAKPFGVGDTAVRVWDVVKWPVLVGVVLVLVSMLYNTNPHARRGFRVVTPGSVLALLVWAAASIGFGIFAGRFGSYDKTYGTLAGIVVFLVWLYLTNVALLLGHELDAQRGPRGEDEAPEPDEP